MSLPQHYCGRLCALLVVWVAAAALLGYFTPQAFRPLAPYMEWLFAVTMFGISALLSLEDFRPIFKAPRLVVLGTIAQFAIMPALAFVIAKVLDLPSDLAFGLILAGAVPDAMAAGVISYLASADVALSVSLTTLTTLISPVVTPSLTMVFGNTYVPVRFLPMMLSILKMVIVPFILGVAARQRFPQTIGRVESLSGSFHAVHCFYLRPCRRPE